MLPKEMIIRVEQALQKVASNALDIFKHDEIIDALNINYDRFIREVVLNLSPAGIQKKNTQLELDKIMPLVVRNYRVPTYAYGISDEYTNNNSIGYLVSTTRGNLPPDYYFLLESTSGIDYISEEYCSNLSKELRSEGTNAYICHVPFTSEMIEDTRGNFSFKLVLKNQRQRDNTYSDTVLFNSTDYPNLGNITKDEDKFHLINLVLDTINNRSKYYLLSEGFGSEFDQGYYQPHIIENTEHNPRIEIYWERFGDYYKKDNFILVSYHQDVVAENLVTSITDIRIDQISDTTANIILTGTNVNQVNNIVIDNIPVSFSSGVSNITIPINIEAYPFNTIHQQNGVKSIELYATNNRLTIQGYRVDYPDQLGTLSTTTTITVHQFKGIYAEIITNETLADFGEYTSINEITDYILSGRARGRFWAVTLPIWVIAEYQDITNLQRKIVPNRIIFGHLNQTATSELQKSTDKRPVATFVNSYINVYNNTNFLVKNIYIDYIRKPKKISLRLNQSCELPEYSQQIIIDMTVAYLQKAIQDPTYQVTMADNKINNQ